MNNFFLGCKDCLKSGRDPYQCHIHFDAPDDCFYATCFTCSKVERVVLDQKEMPNADEREAILDKKL